MSVTNWKRRLAAVLVAAGLWIGESGDNRTYAADLGINLIVNGGFEYVDVNSVGGLNAKGILDWTTTSSGLFAYSHDGASGTPDFANGDPLAAGGSYYFTPNASTPDIIAANEAYQLLDISTGESGNLISQGRASFTLSGFFTGYAQNRDTGNIQVDFLNSSGAVLSSAIVSDTNPQAWTSNRIAGGVPIGTQTARVSIFGTLQDGGPDGYIDNVDFQILDSSQRQSDTLKVMTFNVWTGENSEAGRTKLAEIIRASDADVIGLQEMGNGAGQEVAQELGFHYHQQSSGGIQIISRFPVVGQSDSNLGALIEIEPGSNVWVFNAHHAAYPYQPYDLRDGNLSQSEADVIAAANAARGGQVTTYLNDMQQALGSQIPVFLTGDFNEPSHLDWTQEAADSTDRTFDFEVAYPASTRYGNAGLYDSFREVRTDEVGDRGYTWTPGYPPPDLEEDEVHDRIDIVYHSGDEVLATDAYVIGFDITNPNTDIAVAGYNSDHRAVVVTYSIPNNCFLLGDFDGNCILDAEDANILLQFQHADLSELSLQESYARGDMNGDFQNNYRDFVMFRQLFESANGEGAFVAMLESSSVPESSSFVLLVSAAILIVVAKRFEIKA